MKRLFCALVFIVCALPSIEASDFGTWSSLQVVRSWGSPYAMARLEHRSYEDASATECWFAMAGGGYKFTKWLKSDLSYEFWKVPSAGNISIHKAVLSITGTLKAGPVAFDLREKDELAYMPQSGSLSNTLRSRLRASCKAACLTPYVMYEYFNGFCGTGWIRSLYYAGSEIHIGTHHTIDLFYMYHDYGTASCHLLGLGYVLAL